MQAHLHQDNLDNTLQGLHPAKEEHKEIHIQDLANRVQGVLLLHLDIHHKVALLLQVALAQIKHLVHIHNIKADHQATTATVRINLDL